MSKRVHIKGIKSEILARVDKRMRKMGPAVTKEWKSQARRKISRNLGRYLNAIVDESDGDTIKVTLRGKKANIIEHGMNAYDVKDYLIGPRKLAVNAKEGSKGRYADIPFTQSQSSLARDLGSGIRKYARATPLARKYNPDSGTYHETPGPRPPKTLLATALSGRVGRIQAKTLAKLRSKRHRGLMRESFFIRQGGRLVPATQMVKFRRASRASGPWMRSPVPAKKIARLLQRRVKHIVNRVLSGRDI